MQNFEQAMEFINSFSKLGKPVNDLNRIKSLLSVLGNPQDTLKFIHIAGTNGKGSTAQMCSEILVDSGMTVGLFTSPYMFEYTDRIRVNHRNIEKQSLSALSQRIQSKLVMSNVLHDYSQFEITMAIALLYFNEKKCDIVVFETGLGGLLDCTNVIKSHMVSIITSISYDHTKILGDSLESIAYHKAGIMKNSCPCVVSDLNTAGVMNVFMKNAKKLNAPLITPKYSDIQVISEDIFGSKFCYKENEFQLQMSGKHQILNAISVIEAMQFIKEVSIVNIQNGLKKAKVTGRAEVVYEKPLVILDGAHNPAGALTLQGLIKSVDCKKKTAIVGMLSDKMVEESLEHILKSVDEITFVDDFHPNAVPVSKLSEIASKVGIRSKVATNAFNELQKLIKVSDDDDAIFVCGSLYLISQVLNQLEIN